MNYTFNFTDDNSIGLYDNSVHDIYHSTSGAYKEAIDKFVIPSQLERFKNSTCYVLDICYGIGYNTKALLKYSADNNLNINFNIDALEINKELIEISPFIKNYGLEEIDKFILNSYLKNYEMDFSKILKIINKNNKFLTINKPDFKKILEFHGYKYNPFMKLNAFLHNIYYHNKTIRNKKGQKSYNFDKNYLKWHVNDARKAILSSSTKYDLIFLDAFTPSKQPILWTLDFISELKKHLNKETGVILSYSTAVPFRNTLHSLGLNVGMYYKNDSKINSTLATYDPNLIKYKLDDFELGLLKTRAGICYRDENFSLSSDEILNKRKNEVNNSDLESASSYYKRNNRKYGKF